MCPFCKGHVILRGKNIFYLIKFPRILTSYNDLQRRIKEKEGGRKEKIAS
jgi:uncharacterized protein YdcH (DUF465 family)